MQDWLAASAAANPQKIALAAPGFDLTYADLHAQVNRVCARLLDAGMKRGDHLGVLLPNGVEFARLIHAAARLGLVLVPLNLRLTPEELTWQVAWADCAAVVCSDVTREKVQGIASAQIALIRAEAACDVRVPRKGDPWIAPTQTDPIPHEKGEFDLDQAQSIVFTSGTTGKPKGAQITFGSHFWSAVASSWRLGTLPDDRWLLTLPLFHVGGLAVVFRCCLYGTTVVLPDSGDRFEPDALMDTLEQQRVTLISLVPTMLYRLLELDRSFPPSLRLILLGGAAASPALVKRCAERGIPIATTYGLTEAASQVATLPPDEARDKPGSVGKPLLFASVRVVDEQGRDVPTGDYGEVLVGGRMVMKGYYKQPHDTALQNGEFHTGDIGYLDDDGDLWLVQRRSDLIVSGGENIYPAEVENVLLQHPAVAAVCVVGLPSEEWGQQVAAAVVLKPGVAAAEGEIIAFCRQHLAGYKCPRRLVFLADLPLTGSGKVSRRLVVEQFGSA